MILDVGRICVKTAGREAGNFCVVTEVLEDGFLMVTGPKAVTKVKRRKCNADHLEPTPEVIKIAKKATDNDVIEAYRKQGIFEKMDVRPPSAKDIEHASLAEKKRLTAKKEKPAEAKREEKVPEEKKEAKKEEKAEEKHEEKKEHKEDKHEHKEKHHEKEHKKAEHKEEKHHEEKYPKKAEHKEEKHHERKEDKEKHHVKKEHKKEVRHKKDERKDHKKK